MEGIYIALGAVLGAAISSIITGRYNRTIKELELQAQRQAKELELESQKTKIALECAQLKHQQVLACQDWAIRSDGKARAIELWDPLQSVIEYLAGIDEFRKSGTWSRAQNSHYSCEPKQS